MNKASRWDIFCAVVDNYGDIGVCWRLARQLTNEHGITVRLWVDDLAPLARLRPGADAGLDAQRIDGVEVRHWPRAFPQVVATDLADVVIEAFACEIPAPYIAAMASRQPAPAWINLEYLSAEDWVEGTHGLPSPHPRLPLTKYFFFPGFSAKTGGLIREADYAACKVTFDETALRGRLGLPARRENELTVSLFGYENPALPGLLAAWAQGAQPVTCLVPENRLLPGVQDFFGQRDGALRRGQLTAHAIPFVPQANYDALLWLCDLNFVRGEDSFVRAQWAERPFVWHIYPQADAAHRVKLEAFLERYLAALPAAAGSATRDFWTAWNEGGDAGAAWPAFARAMPALRTQAKAWSETIAAPGDLATNLVRFVRQKSKF